MTTLENRPNAAVLVIDVQNGVVGGVAEVDLLVEVPALRRHELLFGFQAGQLPAEFRFVHGSCIGRYKQGIDLAS